MKSSQVKRMISPVKVLEKQMEIINLQTEIIDCLALELLQGGIMTEADLQKISKAATLQENLENNGRKL